MVIWVSSSVRIAGAIKGTLNWFPESMMLIHFLYHTQLWFEWELYKNIFEDASLFAEAWYFRSYFH